MRHPHDDGVWIGSLPALDRLRDDAPDVDAVVSLCRVGAEQVPDGMTSVQVWLIDQAGKNLNLSTTLEGAARTIADLRQAGHGLRALRRGALPHRGRRDALRRPLPRRAARPGLGRHRGDPPRVRAAGVPASEAVEALASRI